MAASIHDMVAEVQGYVPGYRLRGEPQFDRFDDGSGRVATFIEVEGAGDYLPPYSGNLDIMTAAATKVGEEIARHLLTAARRGAACRTPTQLDIRVTDTVPARRLARQAPPVHRGRTSASIVAALDGAGMPVIEVTHGDGLGGSSFNYGFSHDRRAGADEGRGRDGHARPRSPRSMLPGLGTKDDIKACADLGVSIVRIATHCTEADISIQHFGLAREIGLETVGFLMMAHSQPPEVLADAGPDHGRRRLPVRVRRRLGRGHDPRGRQPTGSAALVAELGGDAQVGFHGHENLGLSVANSVLAVAGRRGADRRLHPGLRRRGGQHAAGGASPRWPSGSASRTGLDVLKMIDVAEDVVRPVMDGECVKDRLAVIMGYAGVYSSLPEARLPGRRALRRERRRHPPGVRPAEAGGRPGGPDHPDRGGAGRHARHDGGPVDVVATCADVLAAAVRDRTAVPRLTEASPDLTLEDGYADPGRGAAPAGWPRASG